MEIETIDQPSNKKECMEMILKERNRAAIMILHIKELRQQIKKQREKQREILKYYNENFRKTRKGKEE